MAVAVLVMFEAYLRPGEFLGLTSSSWLPPRAHSDVGSLLLFPICGKLVTRCRTMRTLNLSSTVRNSGGGAFGFVAAQWPLEYIGATGGHYARGECVASSG